MANSEVLLSHEALCAQNQAPTMSLVDFLRLRWKPFGQPATSIHVVGNACDQPSADGETYTQEVVGFHPISASSITVTQEFLDDWEQDWVYEHLPHANYDGAVWVGGGEDMIDTDENAVEDEPIGDDETGRTLMRCCDTRASTHYQVDDQALRHDSRLHHGRSRLAPDILRRYPAGQRCARMWARTSRHGLLRESLTNQYGQVVRSVSKSVCAADKLQSQ
jgi:hypothetical protein